MAAHSLSKLEMIRDQLFIWSGFIEEKNIHLYYLFHSISSQQTPLNVTHRAFKVREMQHLKHNVLPKKTKKTHKFSLIYIPWGLSHCESELLLSASKNFSKFCWQWEAWQIIPY